MLSVDGTDRRTDTRLLHRPCWLTDWMSLLWQLTNRRWNYNARIDKWYSLYNKNYSLQSYYTMFTSLTCKAWQRWNCRTGHCRTGQWRTTSQGWTLLNWTMTDECGQLIELKLQNFIPWEDFHSVSLSDTYALLVHIIVSMNFYTVASLWNYSHSGAPQNMRAASKSRPTSVTDCWRSGVLTEV